MLKTCFFSGPDIFWGKTSWFSRLHSFILQVHLIVFRRVGLVLPLFWRKLPFYPLQPALLRSASPIFFLGGIFVGQFIESNKNHGHFPRKNTHSVGRVWAKMPRKATCLLQDYDWGPGVAIEWQPAPRKGHQEWIKFKVMPLRLLECHRKPQCLPVKSRRILDFCSFLSLCNS